MKKLKLFFVLIILTLTAFGQAQLELPYSVKVLNPKPLDAYYYNTSFTPYTNTAQVISQVALSVRYIGQTFNVNGTEYCFCAGTANGNLAVKGNFWSLDNGGTLTNANTLTIPDALGVEFDLGSDSYFVVNGHSPGTSIGLANDASGGTPGDYFETGVFDVSGTYSLYFSMTHTGAGANPIGAVFQDTRPSPHGIEYSSPGTYTTNPGSLSDKSYSDTHLIGKTFTNSPSSGYVPVYNGSNFTWGGVNNGLSVSSSTFQLGGTLIKNTLIDGAFDLKIGSVTPVTNYVVNSAGDLTLQNNGTFFITASGSGLSIQAPAGQIVAQSPTITMTSTASGSPGQFRNTGGGNVIISTSGGGSTGDILLNSAHSIGVGVNSPTAYLHIKAGTATAGTAPVKIDGGTLLGTPENYAIEPTSTHLYWTNGSGSRVQIDQQVAGSNKQIQYNNSGSFGASSNFTWDNGLTALFIGNGSTTGLLIETDQISHLNPSVNFGIGISDNSTGNGGSMTIGAGNSTGSNGNGGNLILSAGSKNGSGTNGSLYLSPSGAGSAVYIGNTTVSGNKTMVIASSSTDAGISLVMTQGSGTGSILANLLSITTTNGLTITGQIKSALPTSSAGLPSGTFWNNSGVVNIVP